jgi:hypothetical protein
MLWQPPPFGPTTYRQIQKDEAEQKRSPFQEPSPSPEPPHSRESDCGAGKDQPGGVDPKIDQDGSTERRDSAA